MNTQFRNEQNPTDEELKPDWEVALSNEPMNTSPSDDALLATGDSSDTIVQIARSEMNDLIAQEVDSLYAERSETKLQIQIVTNLFGMLQLGNSAVPEEIKTASVRLLKAFIFRLFSRGSANDLMSEYLDCCMK